MDEDRVYYAVEEALPEFSDWDKETSKIKKQIRNYFNKGAKSIAMQSKPWYESVNEYADNAIGSLFLTFGQESWLKEGTVDFTACLNAGIQDNFPPAVLAKVKEQEYKEVVIAAYSRAWDENVAWPLVDEHVRAVAEGPKSRKKIYSAIEQGWRDAYSQAMMDLEVFLRAWIDRSLFHLATAAEPNGGLQYVLQPQGAEKIFNGIIHGGGIPYKLMEASSPPPGWFIGTCMKEGFSYYATPEEDLSGGKGWGKGKGKGKGKEKRPPNPIFADLPDGICRKYCVGQCDREDCKFAHDDNAKWQVEMKIAEQDAQKATSAAEQSGEGSEDAGEPSAKKARSEW